MAGEIRNSRSRLVAVFAVLALVAAGLYLVSPPGRDSAQTLSTWGWMLFYRVQPIEDESALAQLHIDAQDASREQCVACHGDRTDSELLVHRIHLESELLENLACQECHPQIDLGPRSNTSSSRWVDVGFCKKCHSEFPGLRPGSPMQDVEIDADCASCHTGDLEAKHEQPYLPRAIETSECKGCHGDRVLPWTPRHERDDWLQLHGPEALETGTDGCFECHDFGLKFCDECHQETPPSHLPAEVWRAIHPDEAQADTRVCYSCHETGYCKKCHVNHEVGWMENHPAWVKENTDSSCDECHSPSSCSYCHTKLVLLGESDLTTASP